MERGSTLFLKIAIYLLGAIILGLAIFWVPSLASSSAEMNPDYAYLQYPVLIGVYITLIPFYIALYQSLKLLDHIQHDNAFSHSSVLTLKRIKYCAVVISILYLIGMVALLFQKGLHPGLALIGLTIGFASAAISVFGAVLEKLLKNALEIKSENDLTI